MAPEQARAEKSVGPAADQYALGVILYEALTGRLPRNSDQSQALLYSVAYGSFPPPSTYVKLPVALEQILLKAMAPDPEQRFGSMHELAAALLPFASPEFQAAARPRSNPNHRTGSGEAQRHAPAGNSEQLTVGHAQVLDIPTLLALLGERKGLVAACIAGLLTLSGTCLWLAEPNGLPVVRAAPAQHLVRAKVAPQPHPQRAQR
jgi:serine/threonine protein kinase